MGGGADHIYIYIHIYIYTRIYCMYGDHNLTIKHRGSGLLMSHHLPPVLKNQPTRGTSIMDHVVGL